MVLLRITQIFILLTRHVESFTRNTLRRGGRGGRSSDAPSTRQWRLHQISGPSNIPVSDLMTDTISDFIEFSDTISNATRLASPPRRKPGRIVTKGVIEKYALLLLLTR